MGSGFLISPYDQLRICSGLAIWILIWSKVIAWPVWPRIFISSFMLAIPYDSRVQRKLARHPRGSEDPELGPRLRGDDGWMYQAARLSRSTFSPNDFSSFTSTLKLSGTPASKLSCSRTIAS